MCCRIQIVLHKAYRALLKSESTSISMLIVPLNIILNHPHFFNTTFCFKIFKKIRLYIYVCIADHQTKNKGDKPRYTKNCVARQQVWKLKSAQLY